MNTRKLFSFSFAAMFILVASMAWSQNQSATLSGKIIDAANGETLPGASVLLQPAGRGAATDEHGRFLISHLPPGKYRVQVSLIGYATHHDSLLLAPGQVQYLQISLRQQALAFPEVTVTAEHDRRTQEVNLSREYITNAEIRTTSAVMEPDLFRSLALLPGIIQANDFNSRFFVRGGSSNENHVLVEGMTIHNPYHAMGFFSTFDVDAIKAVEIHRSVFPARYGERLSSVTNVVLRDGNAQRFAGLGMVSLASSKFLLEGPLLKYHEQSGRKWTFMLNGRRTYIDQIVNYPLFFYDFAAKSVYDSGKKTRITLHGFYGLDQLQGIETPFPLPKPEATDIRWNNYALGVQWQQFFSTGNLWTNHLSYSAFHSLAHNTPLFLPTDFRQDNDIRELSFNSEWQGRLWNRWRATLGYGWSRYHIDQYLDKFINNFLRQSFQSRWRDLDQHKLYAEIAGGVGEHWLYEASMTGLYFPYHRKQALAPRLGVKYLLNDKWRLKAGFGRHYQYLTTLEDDDDPLLLFDAWLPTAPARPIARADHYGFGIELSASSVLEADLELYCHRRDHLTRYNRTQLPGEPFYLNGSGESYGVELRAHYNLKTYYGFVNYSFGKANSYFVLRNEPMRAPNDFRGHSFPSNSDVRHILNAVTGFRRGKWDINLTLLYQSGRPYTAVLASTQNLVDLPFLGEYFPLIFEQRSDFAFYGAPGYIYSAKNSRRYPFYQRVDFRSARSFSWLGMEWTFFGQIYNVFSRLNAAFYFADYDYFGLEAEHPFGLPIVPTFGISFRF
ncbi:MAG: TonB-dependent receptor [candidate division KSB1 bacterium]